MIWQGKINITANNDKKLLSALPHCKFIIHLLEFITQQLREPYPEIWAKQNKLSNINDTLGRSRKFQFLIKESTDLYRREQRNPTPRTRWLLVRHSLKVLEACLCAHQSQHSDPSTRNKPLLQIHYKKWNRISNQGERMEVFSTGIWLT